MYRVDHSKYTLQFRRPAGTSRGTLNSKDSWILRITDVKDPSRFGLGEVSLIPGLSPDDPEKIEAILDQFCEVIHAGKITIDHWHTFFNQPGLDSGHINNYQHKSPVTNTYLEGNSSPAIRFGIETAIRDLERGGERILYPSGFTSGTFGIPINGLIWMGTKQHMLQQVKEKLDSGFSIIKLKVGALDFEDELEVLKAIRTEHAAPDLEIRLDANGAWSPGEAVEKLKRLSEFNIHSLEQPIRAGNPAEMSRVVGQSPIPVALDEELIGTEAIADKQQMLREIRPDYIILKPSLLGGIGKSVEWIRAAEELGIGWWITSALEANIGLNAIAQWTATLETNLPQGLGTGSLFINNIPSPLAMYGDRIHYSTSEDWDLSVIDFRE